MKIKINDTLCTVKCTGIYKSGGLRLEAIDESNEPYMTITTNIPDHWKEVWRGTPSENEYPRFPLIIIKDYSENEGITQLMQDQGLITGDARIAKCDGMFRLAKMSEELSKSVTNDIKQLKIKKA